jgi:hypothetical protein
MKYAYFFIALALLSFCNSKSRKNESDESISSSDSLTTKEAEYLITRDSYIKQFEPLQKTGLDTIDRMDDRALLDLERSLQEILKDSKYSTQGKINLRTLRGYLGFGMADGLYFEKDSMRIFYTSKNLFKEYYKGVDQLEKLTPDDLPNIFQWTVLTDVFVTNFFSKKIVYTKNIIAYVMIGQTGNMSGPGPPDHLFALISADKYVYVITKTPKEPIKELPQCKAIGDSIGKIEFDTLFEHYRKCYLKNLPSDPQFERIKKQLESMVKYLER